MTQRKSRQKVKIQSTSFDFSRKHEKHEQSTPGVLIPRDLVSIIISDQKYRISMRKLNKYPSTLLGDPSKRMKFWSEHDQAYIFERRCRYVVPILEFYITGNKLQRNEFLDLEGFLDEIEFFEMENTILFVKSKVIHGSEWEQRINHFVKDPNSSKAAKLFSTLSLSLTVYSIVQFCLETIQELNHLRMAFFICEIVLNSFFSFEIILRYRIS
jgi:hypothetical protein